MASQIRKANGTRRKRRRLRHFFLNGKLHLNLHVNYGTDVLTAWNYPDGRLVKYNYSDTVAKHGKAFTMQQVSKMLNRKRLQLERAIIDGHIERPQHTYSIDENRNMGTYYWTEQEIIDAHSYFSTVHFGRPRKDGLVTPYPLPTPRELRAMIDNDEILSLKPGEEYTPTWKANR